MSDDIYVEIDWLRERVSALEAAVEELRAEVRSYRETPERNIRDIRRLEGWI